MGDFKTFYKNLYKSDDNFDISGNVYICNELCNVVYNYNSIKRTDIKISNTGRYISLDITDGGYILNNPKSVLGIMDEKFYLRKIDIISPSILSIRSQKFDIQINLIHEGENGNIHQVVTILGNSTENKDLLNNLGSKFLDELILSQNLKKKNSVGLPLDIQIKEFEPFDLFPDNHSFYTYNINNYTNFVVLENKINISSDFISTYIQKILGNTIKFDNLKRTEPPDDRKIDIFYKKYEDDNYKKQAKKEVQKKKDSCANLMKKEICNNNNSKNNKNKLETENNNNEKETKDTEDTKENTKVETEQNTEEETEYSENKKPKWYNILLKLFLIFISIGIIGLIIYFVIIKYYPNAFNLLTGIGAVSAATNSQPNLNQTPENVSQNILNNLNTKNIKLPSNRLKRKVQQSMANINNL